MLKIFIDSFSPKRIFNLRNLPLRGFILHFLFLVLLVSFPLNYQIVKTGGWDLFGFTAGMRAEVPAWMPSGLPGDIEISRSGMYYDSSDPTVLITENAQGEVLEIVFDPENYYVPTGRALLFDATEITYFDQNGNRILGVNYSGVTGIVRFADLFVMDPGAAVEIFADMIDEAFSPFAILRSVTFYTFITLVLDTLLVVVLAAIFIFLRIRFQRVTTFGENLRIVIASMTLPSVISFIFGIIGFMEINAFTTVIFQFFTPLIALFSIYRGSRLKEIDNRGV